MTFYYALLLVVVIAIVLLATMAIFVRLDKKRPEKQYDERQQVARGKAFEWAVIAGIAYFAVIALLDVLLPNGLQANNFLIIMIGLALEGFVMECYCIFHDAYLPLTKSPKANIISLYVLGAVQLLSAVNNVNYMRVTWTEDGVTKLAFGEVVLSNNRQSAIAWGCMMVAVVSSLLATLELVHYIRDNRSKQ